MLNNICPHIGEQLLCFAERTLGCELKDYHKVSNDNDNNEIT